MTPFYDALRKREQPPTKETKAPAGIQQIVSGMPDPRAGRGFNRAPVPTADLRVAGQTQVPGGPAGAPAGGVGVGVGVGGRGGADGMLTMDQIVALRKQAGYDPAAQKAELMAGQADVAAAQRALAEGNLADYEKFREGIGLFGEERLARAKEDLSALVDEKKQAKAMAFLQAGFAILGADPSKGAFSAIGQGALTGLGAYKGDMKDLAAKREKILSRMENIEDLRRQEAVATGEKRLELRGKIKSTEVDIKQASFDMLKGFGEIDRKTADAVTGEFIKGRGEFLDRRSREGVAAAEIKSRASTSGVPAQLQLLRALQADPALMETYQDMQQGKYNPRQAYAKYLSDNEGKIRTTPLLTYPQWLSLTGEMPAGAVSTAPPSGQQRPR
jgi:hypothetical protein